MPDGLDSVHLRMREDELICRIRYHEDRLRTAERQAEFYRAAVKQARLELESLPQASVVRAHLKAA